MFYYRSQVSNSGMDELCMIAEAAGGVQLVWGYLPP